MTTLQIIDQEVRFEIGSRVEISTDLGWVPAEVTQVVTWPDNLGIAYNVTYVPKWEKHNKSYGTQVTGRAVRPHRGEEN
jgi:hypothetical protein